MAAMFYLSTLTCLSIHPSIPSAPCTNNNHNTRSIDVLAVRLYLDRKVEVPYMSNACFGFDK